CAREGNTVNYYGLDSW
nr:immunoglobulin heavy chain junction region [Macaca mulatta]MOX39868.1 immunoglobulin heavy chain junction region [Macaca mulatta]